MAMVTEHPKFSEVAIQSDQCLICALASAVIALIHGRFVPKPTMLCTFAGCGREIRLLSLAHSFGLVDRIE